MSGGGRIGELVRKLDAMASPQFREGLSQKLAEEAQRQYRADFAKGVDPYGAVWAKGKKVSGKTLINTGYLRASGEIEQISAEGFRFRVYAPYASFAQYGTTRSPQRMIVPSARYGLGAWGAPFNRTAVAAIRGLLT